jgi:hypothetical protein
MFACGADGELSLVALADLHQISGEGGMPEPVIVHVTVCRAHLREVRQWLRRMTPEQIDVWPTAALLERWGVFERELPDVPVWRLQHAG